MKTEKGYPSLINKKSAGIRFLLFLPRRCMYSVVKNKNGIGIRFRVLNLRRNAVVMFNFYVIPNGVFMVWLVN